MLSNFDFNITKLSELLLYQTGNPLLFNTGLFLFLFLGFLLIYRLIQNKRYLKMIFVIAFSLYFYYKSSAECCYILLGVCISDYVLANILYRCKSVFIRKAIVAVNVLSNVGMLVYFKYFQLIIETISNLNIASFDPITIILPAGISFFTFRSISYIVDVYRGEMKPVTNPLEYIF